MAVKRSLQILMPIALMLWVGGVGRPAAQQISQACSGLWGNVLLGTWRTPHTLGMVRDPGFIR